MMEVDAATATTTNGNHDEVEVIALEEEETAVQYKSQLELYQDALSYEEAEVARRSADNDQKMFLDTCNQVRSFMNEIFQLKNKQGAKMAEEVEKRRVQILMLVLNMRKLSRTQKVRVRLARDEALDGRQSVDGVTLQLQGLLYEVLHLHKEANRCLAAHTADKDIELMPVEEFYKDAPKEVSRPEVTRKDEHQQKLARLHHELTKRREQTETVKKLSGEQLTVSQQIDQHKTTLSSLAPRISTILQSTVPLQESLALPLTALKEQQDMSHLLPLPLYTLWLQTSAYSEAGDRMLCSIIRGDKDAAAVLHRKIQEEARNMTDVEPSSASDLLEVHPLRVEVTLSLQEGSSVMIIFQYAMQLRFIVSRSLVALKNTPINTNNSDVLTDTDLLAGLFPGDTGLLSPNPATHHQLFRIQGGAQGPHPPVPPHLGRAYKWAQQLSGLVFPDEVPGESSQQLSAQSEEIAAESLANQEPLSSERVHVTLSSIRRRLRARIELQIQVMKLNTVNATKDIPVSGADLPSLFPVAIATELVSWRATSWEDYSKAGSTKAFREEGLAREGGFQYRAHYKRKHASSAVDMYAYVCVSPDHPHTAPLFSLEVKWPEQYVSPAHVQQMEREVNVFWPELIPSVAVRGELLPRCLLRLAVCLDILAETVSKCQEKVYFRPARGPDRALPLKYLPKLRVFSHR